MLTTVTQGFLHMREISYFFCASLDSWSPEKFKLIVQQSNTFNFCSHMWLMPVKCDLIICLYALLIKHRCMTEEAFRYRLIIPMLGSRDFNLFTTAVLTFHDWF